MPGEGRLTEATRSPCRGLGVASLSLCSCLGLRGGHAKVLRQRRARCGDFYVLSSPLGRATHVSEGPSFLLPLLPRTQDCSGPSGAPGVSCVAFSTILIPHAVWGGCTCLWQGLAHLLPRCAERGVHGEQREGLLEKGREPPPDPWVQFLPSVRLVPRGCPQEAP